MALDRVGGGRIGLDWTWIGCTGLVLDWVGVVVTVARAGLRIAGRVAWGWCVWGWRGRAGLAGDGLFELGWGGGRIVLTVRVLGRELVVVYGSASRELHLCARMRIICYVCISLAV